MPLSMATTRIARKVYLKYYILLYTLTLIVVDESSDDRLQGATRISHNLHEEWQGMTAEEKFKATKDSAKELEEFRATKALAT